MNTQKCSAKILILTTALWLGLSGFGLWVLLKYQAAPGVSDLPPIAWPKESAIPKIHGLATLLLIAHPECPCTAASIEELAWIMSRTPNKARVHVLFFKPAAFPKDWEKGSLWSKAEAIPGVNVYCDVDGVEAKHFNVGTSGHAILYDGQGHLLFSGGITRARGHSGSNAGRDAIVALLTRGHAEYRRTNVFGCSLLNISNQRKNIWNLKDFIGMIPNR